VCQPEIEARASLGFQHRIAGNDVAIQVAGEHGPKSVVGVNHHVGKL